MLLNMKVILPEESKRRARSPDIPLYQEAKDSNQNVKIYHTPQGRALYIAFKDKDTLEK